MQAQNLEVAIDSIRVRFGSQALTRAAELPPTQPWSSGTPVDHLTGIGGLPRGRVALFTGSGTSGKLTLALALLASATRAFAHAVVIVGVVDTPSRALAHASSFSLGFSRSEWIWDRGQLVGLRTSARCVKNRVAPPLGETELEICYRLGAQSVTEASPRVSEIEQCV